MRMLPSTPDSSFIHEYIFEQNYTASQEMEWFTEASAEYYAALLAYKQGLISFDDCHGYVENDNYANDVLADSNSWSSEDVPYFKVCVYLLHLMQRSEPKAMGVEH